MNLSTKLARASWLLACPALAAFLLVGCASDPPPPGSDGSAGAGNDGRAACPTVNGDGGGASAPATPALHVEGNQIKDPHGNVVILRGVDLPDLGDLQSWEGGISAMIDRVTDGADIQGCSPSWQTQVVRLAVLPADSGTTPAQYGECSWFPRRSLDGSLLS